MNQELKEELNKFIEYFEQVLDKDWEYTSEMLGIPFGEEKKKIELQQHKECEKIFGDQGPFEYDGGTFLKPSIPLEDACRDWGHKALLLKSYKNIKKLLETTEPEDREEFKKP